MAATIFTFPTNPTVVSAHNDGGLPLIFPEVNLIFWGKAWSADPPPKPTAHTITSAIRSIVNSNFLGELAQVRGRRPAGGRVHGRRQRQRGAGLRSR